MTPADAKPNYADANDGVGGSYQVDPKTGVRTLVERTATHTPPQPPGHDVPVAAVDSSTAAAASPPEVAVVAKKPNASKGR